VPFLIRQLPLLAILLFGTSACAEQNLERGMPAIAVDDYGDTLFMADVPRRIVSLTPASTELLFALGAGSRLVGRTRWDVWPDSARFVPDLGDGIRPNVEAVIGARPDLVLLYGSLENKGAAQRLRSAGVATLSLKVDLPSHFRNLTRVLGRVLRDSALAQLTIDSVDRSLESVREITRAAQAKRVVWIADVDPLVVIGGGSFLTELIELAGGRNLFADINSPSASISVESVISRNPDVVLGARTVIERLRSSEAWRSTSAAEDRRFVEADSYLMGRPSVRMGEAARQLARLLHPELFR
jgi:ABC-type Fe3+-hydroxamate transport system substrate-binding protein